MILNGSYKLIIALVLSLVALCACSTSKEANEIRLSSNFDRDQYINPQDFGYPLSIKEIEENIPADSSFTPISVKGGMRQAFGEVVYPVEAQKQNIRGRVILELYVNANGNLASIAVIQSPHKILQKAAVDAVQKWNYNAAMLNQTPVASLIRVPLNFRMQIQDVNINQ